jgi:hypothetical protein
LLIDPGTDGHALIRDDEVLAWDGPGADDIDQKITE